MTGSAGGWRAGVGPVRVRACGITTSVSSRSMVAWWWATMSRACFRGLPGGGDVGLGGGQQDGDGGAHAECGMQVYVVGGVLVHSGAGVADPQPHVPAGPGAGAGW